MASPGGVSHSGKRATAAGRSGRCPALSGRRCRAPTMAAAARLYRAGAAAFAALAGHGGLIFLPVITGAKGAKGAKARLLLCRKNGPPPAGRQ